MSPWLTFDELVAASGRTRPSAQLQWAIDRGFVSDKRMTDADGRPLVMRALFFASQQQSPSKPQPDWEAARG